MKIHCDRRGTPHCAKRRPPPSGVARRWPSRAGAQVPRTCAAMSGGHGGPARMEPSPDVVGRLVRRHHSALRRPPSRYASPGDHGRCGGWI